MEVRLATAEDVAQVRACVAAAYAVYRSRMRRPPAPVVADYAMLIAQGAVHLAIQRDVVGVLVVHRRPGSLFVENVAVLPRAQGRGVGRLLMAFAEQLARAGGAERIELYTNQAMTENVGFYRGLGYVETGRRLDAGYRRIFFCKSLTRC